MKYRHVKKSHGWRVTKNNTVRQAKARLSTYTSLYETSNLLADCHICKVCLSKMKSSYSIGRAVWVCPRCGHGTF